jgi:hypothetical protein
MVDPVTGTAAAYLLASSGKAGEVAVTVVVTKAAEGLLRKIEDSVNKKWKGSEKQKKRIKDLAKQCGVIRPSESLKRKEYAKSPILNYMKRPQSRGTIYVAYVPAGMGKTTACQAFMDKGYPSNGIAFVPTDNTMPYFDSMLNLLSIDSGNPPEGILNYLIASLSSDPADNTQKAPFLILDDFMTNGPNEADLALLNSIKKCIREKSIIVIIFTGNKTSANFLLSQNNLEYVRPLVTADKLIEIRLKHSSIIRDAQVLIDWKKYVSMKWEKKELKKALVDGEDYRMLSDAQKHDLESRFGQQFDLLSEEERETTTPGGMFDILVGDQPIVQISTLSPSNASASAAADAGISCACGTECSIM